MYAFTHYTYIIYTATQYTLCMLSRIEYYLHRHTGHTSINRATCVCAKAPSLFLNENYQQ